MKPISARMHQGGTEARESSFDWGLLQFGLGVIALLCFVYLVHLLIRSW